MLARMRSGRPVLVLALAVLAAGCGARSSLPEPGTTPDGGTVPDGGVSGGGIILTQGSLTQMVSPVQGDTDVVSFYDYFSSSGHTGFEAVGKSELFFYEDTTTGIVSLVTEHGIDQTTTGQVQPAGKVDQTFTGLPPEVTVAVSDDNSPMELVMGSPGSAQGTWGFNGNTDGGALTGFPLPGSWTVVVTSDFIQGIDTWRFFGPEEIPLDLTEPVTLTAFQD
jgi:hypothetical protein